MSKKFGLIAGLIVYGMVGSAQAEGVFASAVTGSFLAGQCAGDAGDLDANFCGGYLMGSYDQLSSQQRICPGAGVDTAMVVAIGRKFLRDHPEQWDRHPFYLMRTAYQTAFPCG